MQLKEGPGSSFRALGSQYGAIGSPYRPSVPLTEALFNCQIVGHSPGFNCVGPRGASKNIGLGPMAGPKVYTTTRIVLIGATGVQKHLKNEIHA